MSGGESGLGEGVGCAAVFLYTTLGGSLPKFESIHIAELFAIYITLQCILSLSESSYTIFIYSRSALGLVFSLFRGSSCLHLPQGPFTSILDPI